MKRKSNYRSELAVRRAIVGLLGIPRHTLLTVEDQQFIYQLIGKLSIIAKQYKDKRVRGK